MIEIEEYNYGIREKYNRRLVKASSMSGFIHFKDVGHASTGNHQSTLVSSGTHVFTEKAAIMNQPSQAAAILTIIILEKVFITIRLLKKMAINGFLIYPELVVEDMSS